MPRRKSNPLRRRKASVARSAPLRPLAKTATGIQGLDEVTGGGLPRGRTTLICGSAGSGKTIEVWRFGLLVPITADMISTYCVDGDDEHVERPKLAGNRDMFAAAREKREHERDSSKES